MAEAKKLMHGTGSTALSKKKKKRHVINVASNYKERKLLEFGEKYVVKKLLTLNDQHISTPQ